MKRKEELEDKFIEFEIERDSRLARRGESKDLEALRKEKKILKKVKVS